MSPHEVAGLNYLAKKQGTKLTVNPDTGLPEAFSLGGFFSSLLPMFAGIAFAPETGGFSMAPLLAGAATGAGLAAVKGENPLMGGLMGGLGGYSGGQLGPELAAAQPGGWVPGQIVKGAANPLMDTSVNTALSGAQNSMMANPLITNAANSMTQAGLGAGSGVGFMDKGVANIMNAGKGVGNIATGQPGAWDAFKAAGGTPMQLAMPVGGAILGGLEPSDIYGEPIDMSAAKKKQAYDPYATLNLGNDTGLRLVAKGGYIDGYATGGTVTTGGLRDLYSATDTQSNPQLSRDGYGVGRLESLARQQSMNQAQTTGYAMGGPVSFADGGDANKEDMMLAPIDQSLGITSLTPPITSTNPGQAMPIQQVQNAATALSNTASSDSSIIAQVANNLRTDPNYQPKNPIEAAIAKQIKGTDQTQQGQGLGSLGAQPSQPMAPSYTASQPIGPTYYAGMNAPRGFAEGGDASLNLDKLPSLNVNTGMQSMGGSSSGMQDYTIDPNNIWSQLFSGTGMLDKMVEAARYDKGAKDFLTGWGGMHPVEKPKTYQMAHGGYLDGPGTGLSDSIPATIEGKQPARLADGEFVVSSDVVSALGEGSSKAGSKRLYDMMDRIRQKAHGKKKQINKVPESILPA
jgi:hypothetical protein